MYMRRKIDCFLENWKKDDARRPLIVKGARQIGKTESIRKFAQANYESIVEINFATDQKYKMIADMVIVRHRLSKTFLF